MTTTTTGATTGKPALPDALRAATAQLVSERGPTGFSLREVARRAGVSHAAPAHHFGDARGLLTSVAAEGFTTLCANFDAAVDGIDEPVERLTAMGKAYVHTAIENSGHFGVMCNDELVDGDALTVVGPELISHRGYYVTWPEGEPADAVRALIDWLDEQVTEEEPGSAQPGG